MKKKTFLVLVIGLVSPLLLSGCFLTDKITEKFVEEAIETGTNGDVDMDIDGESITFGSDDGDSTWTAGEGTEIPDGFPNDVYLYKNAEIIMASSHEDEDNATVYSVTYMVDEEMSDIADKYVSEQEKNGWKQVSKTDMSDIIILSFEKGDDRFISITITVNEDEPGSVVGVTCS